MVHIAQLNQERLSNTDENRYFFVNLSHKSSKCMIHLKIMLRNGNISICLVKGDVL